MARTNNANYGLGEKVPDTVPEKEKRPSRRIVYEDETPTVSENENSDSSDEETLSERTISIEEHATDSDDETEPLQHLDMWFQPTEYMKKIKVGTRCYVSQAVETLMSGLKHPLKAEEKSWFLNHPQFKHFFHIQQESHHKVQGMWMLLVRTAHTDKKKEAWFVVNGVPIRYSLREHALISGLNCRNYPLNYSELGSMAFVERYFGAVLNQNSHTS